MRGTSATPSDLPSDLGRRIAAGDPRAMHELVATRAAAVHAFAVELGRAEGRTGFVVAVLAAARGADDVDRQLLAAARDMAAGERTSRRRRRRAERSFVAVRAQALPISVAGAVLRTLDDRTLAAPPAPRRATAATAAGTGHGAAPSPVPAAAPLAPLAPRSTGPGDWVPASLRRVNGVAHPPPVAPPVS